MAKKLTVEQRFPTKRARDIADAAIDRLPATDRMDVYIETWLQTYFANGGEERVR